MEPATIEGARLEHKLVGQDLGTADTYADLKVPQLKALVKGRGGTHGGRKKAELQSLLATLSPMPADVVAMAVGPAAAAAPAAPAPAAASSGPQPMDVAAAGQ